MATQSTFARVSNPAVRLLPRRGAAHWLDGVSDDVVEFLTSRWTVKHVAAGACLMRAGGRVPGLCFVLSGTLRVATDCSPTAVTLALVGAGEVVGELGLLDGASPASSTEVTAVDVCEVGWIDRESFRDAMERWPCFARGVAQLLARRLRQADYAIHALVALEVDQRVAQRLLHCAAAYGEPMGDRAVTLPMRITQQDLAGLVGASRERTNRALVAFKRRGWIAVDGQSRVTLLRPDLLARRVQGPGARDRRDA